MDYLQYNKTNFGGATETCVLNLIINGLPSIFKIYLRRYNYEESFKPYYKWITFNIL